MELTPEQQQKIREEEHLRLAEEQYRAKVRQELSGEAQVRVPVIGHNKKNHRIQIMLFVVGLLTLLAVAIGIVRDTPSNHPAEVEATESNKITKKSADSKDSRGADPIPIPQELSTERIAELGTKSVVVVENFDGEGQKASQGSGYIYSTDGIVITNYHVIRGANRVNVLGTSGTMPVESILGYDITKDVAALKISQSPAPALETDDSEVAHVGDRVVAIGAPLGLESTVSEGIVSALRGAHVLQTTASISPGSSGGPLLNKSGRVIGLTTSTILNGQALNFAVSSRYVTELLSRKEEISLSEMLTRTRLVQPLVSNTFMVGPRGRVPLQFSVGGQQGALLEGTYSITGGSGNDVAVSLIDVQRHTVLLNSGRVSQSGQIRLRLTQGTYQLVFDNSFSYFKGKSISPELNLLFYK